MKVLKTILRAFILGIGVGVLVAPRAGAETRRMLSEKLNGLLDGTDFGTGQQYAQPNATSGVTNPDAITM